MRLLAIALAALVAAGGCGGGDPLPAAGPARSPTPTPTPAPSPTPTPTPAPTPSPSPSPDLRRDPPGTTVVRQSETRYRFTVPIPNPDHANDVVVFDLDTTVADAMGLPVTEFNLSTRVSDGLITLVDARIDGRDVVPEDERCLDVLRGATLLGRLTRFDDRAEADEMLFESAYYDEAVGGCLPARAVFGFSAPVE